MCFGFWTANRSHVGSSRRYTLHTEHSTLKRVTTLAHKLILLPNADPLKHMIRTTGRHSSSVPLGGEAAREKILQVRLLGCTAQDTYAAERI